MDQLLIGIDWSQAHYDVCILATNNAILSQFRIANSSAGLEKLRQKIAQFGLSPEQCLVGIETNHNIIFDYLLACSYRVYVIAPSVVNSSRGRFGASGAHTDRSDARLIADLLWTDRQRFAPWRPDSELLNKMKVKLSHIDNLTKTIIQQSNRLQAILLRVYPQPLHAFSKLSIPITMHFLKAYPTPAALETMSYHEFAKFCRAHHCHPRQWIKSWYQGLQESVPQADPSMVAAYEPEICFLAELILALLRQKKQAIQETQTMFGEHPDHAIFASLPGAGDLLQPKLLVMFGEDRERFPTPGAIRQLAGTCPVTKQSGKKKYVAFRKACNRAYRDTAQQYAMASVTQSDWAAGYYQRAKERGHSKNSAFRCLANRWLGVIWKMWQTHQVYDETYHLRQIHQHRRPTH